MEGGWFVAGDRWIFGTVGGKSASGRASQSEIVVKVEVEADVGVVCETAKDKGF